MPLLPSEVSQTAVFHVSLRPQEEVENSRLLILYIHD